VLKGWRFGGAYRWQDNAAIGYPVKVFPDGSGVYDVKNPFYGPTESNVDAWIGYSRKLTEKIRWSAQLNVRNIGVGNRLIPVSAQPDGTYTQCASPIRRRGCSRRRLTSDRRPAAELSFRSRCRPRLDGEVRFLVRRTRCCQIAAVLAGGVLFGGVHFS
jgi:hypothetical protein